METSRFQHYWGLQMHDYWLGHIECFDEYPPYFLAHSLCVEEKLSANFLPSITAIQVLLIQNSGSYFQVSESSLLSLA